MEIRQSSIDETKAVVEAEALAQDKKEFEHWFYAVMFASETCLMRDVLRNQKSNLFAEWQRVKPYG